MITKTGRAERWKQIEQIYLRALDLRPDGGARAGLPGRCVWLADLALLDLTPADVGELNAEAGREPLREGEFLETVSARHQRGRVSESRSGHDTISPVAASDRMRWRSGSVRVVWATSTARAIPNLHRDVALKILPSFAFDTVPSKSTPSSSVSVALTDCADSGHEAHGPCLAQSSPEHRCDLRF